LSQTGRKMLQIVVLFEGSDASGQPGLWETDSTAGGTFELAQIAGSNGLSPDDLTGFDGQAWFAGFAPTDGIGLWTTDGTTAGTMELFSISGGHTPLGFDLTVFNNQVVCNVTTSIDDTEETLSELWVTNGTGAGTQELTDIAGANETPSAGSASDSDSGGLDPSDLTVFGDEVLFRGLDSGGVIGLWTTDGTAAGTHELTDIAGANSSGLLSEAGLPDFTVYGGEVLFSAKNSSNQTGLWTTNGTVAGTRQLTSIAGANSKGLFDFAGLPGSPDLTDFGSEVLFDGVNAAGHRGLWVTNGTGKGTRELTGFPGASTSGLDPSNMTVFNNEVLFNGVDSSGDAGLWVTNGTAAGTYELTGIAGADPTGLDPTGLTALNGEVLFSGKDARGDTGLWETNGTAAGTQELAVAAAAATGLAPLDLTAVTLESDDILFQNTAGQPAVWEMNGATPIGGGLTLDPGPAWKAIEMGDFSGNGDSDILFQSATGQIVIWDMNGNRVIGGATFGSPGQGWEAIGTGDFNDGSTFDVLFQSSNGQLGTWAISGTNSRAEIGLNPGVSWKAIGTGDFTGDGNSDILLQNSNGQLAIWEMKGASVIGGGILNLDPGAGWKAIGTGDFTGDEDSDILFQNSAGQLAIWEMNGTSVIGGGIVSISPGSGWHAIGTGGEGSADILFQNTSGQIAIWEMSATNVIGGGVVNPNPGSSWRAVGLT
jgi:ELWxxDGT repeat protein